MIDFFLRWWLRSGRYNWSKLRRRIFEHGYLKQELPKVKSLEEIEACLKQVKWTMDGPLHLFDSISYPQLTWAKKKDDCDGFAALACEFLNNIDSSYNPLLLTVMVHPIRKSHTVCVFSKPDGSLGLFDNGRLKDGGTDFGQVVATITGDSYRLICWDVRQPADFALVEFHNKLPTI